jgi:DNA (cytosine-5)-methyltransferase 1
MRFVSMFSGIDAASVAWGPLGWKAAAFCEIEKFPSSVLAHHYPDVPNLGDVTKADFDAIGPIDLAVFGSPCQSFSIAGKRLGLDDARGNLALLAGSIIYRKRPRWFVFENVPGLLSSDDGWDFGTLLAAYAGYPSGSVFKPPAEGWGSAGVVVQANGDSYGLAWRVLDAQYFGVAQRRRRVFVVGYAGDWRRAAAVLFERHSLSGNPAPRREAGKAAPTIPSRSSAGGGLGTDFDCDGGLIASTGETSHCLNAGGMGRQDYETETMVIMERGRNGEPNLEWRADGTANAILTPNGGRGGLGVGAVCTPKVATLDGLDTARTLTRRHDSSPCHDRGMDVVAFTCSDQSNSPGWERPFAPTINAQVPNDTSNIQTGVRIGSAVRRLTPRECERLQGFPDDYTLIPYGAKAKPEIKEELAAFFERTGQYLRETAPDQWEFDRAAFEAAWPRIAADGPRYKALGNSMAVPVMSWIGQRIAAVEALATEEQRAAA